MLSTVLETSHSSLLTVFFPVTKTDTVLQLLFCVRKKVNAAYFSSHPELFCHCIFLSVLLKNAFLQIIWKNWLILCPSLAVTRFLPEKSFRVSLVFCPICNLFQTGTSTCKKVFVSPGLMCCMLGCLYIYTYICTHKQTYVIFIGISYEGGSSSQLVKMDCV